MIFIDKHRKRPTLMPYWFESLCRYKSCKSMKILSTENIFLYWSHIFVCPAFFKAMTHTRECMHNSVTQIDLFFVLWCWNCLSLYFLWDSSVRHLPCGLGEFETNWKRIDYIENFSNFLLVKFYTKMYFENRSVTKKSYWMFFNDASSNGKLLPDCYVIISTWAVSDKWHNWFFFLLYPNDSKMFAVIYKTTPDTPAAAMQPI